MSTQHRFADWVTRRWFEVLKRRKEQAKLAGDEDLARLLEERCKRAVVVEMEDIIPSRVQFGTFVTVFGIEEEEERSFQIVSADEADIGRELLSALSPLAQALYGAREGDEVRVVTGPGAESTYEVTHIVLHPSGPTDARGTTSLRPS